MSWGSTVVNVFAHQAFDMGSIPNVNNFSEIDDLFSFPTGYVPDTDSEAGTLTTNSPLDWMEKHVGIGPTLSSVEEQDDSYRESFTEGQGKISSVFDLFIE